MEVDIDPCSTVYPASPDIGSGVQTPDFSVTYYLEVERPIVKNPMRIAYCSSLVVSIYKQKSPRKDGMV